MWRRFLSDEVDDAFRDSRLKIIPSMVDANWMVKKSVGTKPALTGTKITHKYYRGGRVGGAEEREEGGGGAKEGNEANKGGGEGDGAGGGYLEVDLDIGSASVATAAMKVVGGFAKSWVIDLAFVVQGNCAEELPERVLGSIRLCRLDLPATPLLGADGREEDAGAG